MRINMFLGNQNLIDCFKEDVNKWNIKKSWNFVEEIDCLKAYLSVSLKLSNWIVFIFILQL